MDVIRGKLTLFMRRDELDAAWRWIEPVLDGWEQDPNSPCSHLRHLPERPVERSARRDGHEWRQDS